MSKKSASPRRSAASAQPRWSVPVMVAEVPDAGQRIDISADEGVREALASLAGVEAITRLEAGFDLTRQDTDGLHVRGRVSGTVVQNCVVTLEPVESEIDEAIDVVFMPEGAQAPTIGVHDIEAADGPEPLHNGMVDIGELASEFLVLGIDPYPRKPGVAFASQATGDRSESPFAALASLKSSGGGKRH